MTRGERAEGYFRNGYNCAQAIILAFEDLLCGERETLLAASQPFGGGMGRLRLTCGAVSGAAMCLGLCFPALDKSKLYALVQEFAARFSQKNGSVVCGELLRGAGVTADRSHVAEARSADYYQKRPCPLLVHDAADILEEMLKEQGKII